MIKHKRIAFMGASGTGKSMLAKWICDRYGIPFNNVGSRAVAEQLGFESPYDVDIAGKRPEFQHTLQTAKIMFEKEHGCFVTDRTTFDELAYSYMHDFHNNQLGKTVTESYLNAAVEHMHRYDIVFFCPIYAFQNLDGDPKRKSHKRYHEMHEVLIRGLLMRYFGKDPSINICTLTLGEILYRFDSIMLRLEGLDI